MQPSKRFSNDMPPLTLLRQVVSACERFEAEWKLGKRPALEPFLAEVSDADRPRLLHELLALKLELRRQACENPDPAEYLTRFPEYASVVNLAFADQSRLTDTNLANLSTPPLNGLLRESVIGAFQIGQIIHGYKILGKIGSGGMGVVYRAEQTSSGKLIVALKCIQPDFLDGLRPNARKEAISRFRNEVDALIKLGHPHLVPIYYVNEFDGCPYFSMKFLEGGTLADRLATGALPSKEAAILMAKVARAVHHANQNRILHRDLKPANILFDRGGEPYVVDFGLAKQLEPLKMQATPSRAELGTPSYMSPEQARGKEAIDARTDVYGLGATLYHAITGRPPFQAAFLAETLRKVLEEEPVPPRVWNSQIDRDLETICLKCLEKDPARRYGGAAELAMDLERYEQGKPIFAKPVSLSRRVGKWSRRNVLWIGMATAAAVVVRSLSVGFWPRSQNSASSQALSPSVPNTVYVQKIKDAVDNGLKDEAHASWEALISPDLKFEPEDPRSFEWYYLWCLGSRNRLILDGVRKGLGQEVCVTRDGKLVVALGFDSQLRKWDVASGKLQYSEVLPVPDAPSETFTPDGRFIPLGDNDGATERIAIWDTECRPPKRVDIGVTLLGFGASMSDDGRRVAIGVKPKGGLDDSIEVRVCEIDKAAVHSVFTGKAVSHWRISPDGNSLAIAYRRQQNGMNQCGIGVFDLQNIAQPQEKSFVEVQSPCVYAFEFTRDGAVLIAGDLNGFIYQMPISQPQRMRRVHAADGCVNRIAEAPDGRTIAACCIKPIDKNPSETWLSVIDAKTCQRLRSWKTGHSVNGMSYSPDGRGLIVGSAWGLRYLAIDEIADSETMKNLGASELWSVRFSPQGNILAAAGEDNWLRLFDPATGKAITKPLKGHDAMVSCLAWSPEGEFLVSGGYESAGPNRPSHNIRLWNRDGSPRAVFSGTDNSVRCIAVSPYGKTIASGGKDHKVCVWETQSGSLLATLPHQENVNEVLFLNEHGLLVSIVDDGKICLWNWREPRLLYSYSDGVPTWCAALFKKDGTFATAGKSGTAHLWRIDGNKLTRLRSFSCPIEPRAICFTPDGKSLAISGGDKKIRFWQVSSGLEMLALPELPAIAHCLDFSPDGERLAVALHNGNIVAYYAPKVTNPSPFGP